MNKQVPWRFILKSSLFVKKNYSLNGVWGPGIAWGMLRGDTEHHPPLLKNRSEWG
jgi:hypothetical protein